MSDVAPPVLQKRLLSPHLSLNPNLDHLNLHRSRSRSAATRIHYNPHPKKNQTTYVTGPRHHGAAGEACPGGRLHRPRRYRGHARAGAAGGRHAQPLQAPQPPHHGQLRVDGRGTRVGHQGRRERLGQFSIASSSLMWCRYW